MDRTPVLDRKPPSNRSVDEAMSISVSQLELSKVIPSLTPSTPEPVELVIRARRGWIAVDWAELWSHRELLYFLVWRDVKVRYKQAILGIAWAVLAPVLSVLVFTLLFGAKGLGANKNIPGDLPTSLFIFAGLIPWLFISQSISNGGLSLVNQQNLLSKIYMPRLYIPASTIGSGLVDMCISYGVFFAMMACYGYPLSWHIIFLPLLIVLMALQSMGMAFALVGDDGYLSRPAIPHSVHDTNWNVGERCRLPIQEHRAAGTASLGSTVQSVLRDHRCVPRSNVPRLGL